MTAEQRMALEGVALEVAGHQGTLTALREELNRSPAAREVALAITALEDAEMRLMRAVERTPKQAAPAVA